MAPEVGAPVFPAIFPGSGTGRLHGRFGSLSIALSSTPTVPISLLLFEYDIEIQQEFADATAHGDFWYNPLPITQRWTARVRGYFPNSNATTLSTSAFNASGVGPSMKLQAYSDATVNSAQPGTVACFIGNCFASRGRLLVPMAMVTQELELTGIGPPTQL